MSPFVTPAEAMVAAKVSAAIHEGCNASLLECGAGDAHDDDAIRVVNALLVEGLLDLDGVDA